MKALHYRRLSREQCYCKWSKEPFTTIPWNTNEAFRNGPQDRRNRGPHIRWNPFPTIWEFSEIRVLTTNSVHSPQYSFIAYPGRTYKHLEIREFKSPLGFLTINPERILTFVSCLNRVIYLPRLSITSHSLSLFRTAVDFLPALLPGCQKWSKIPATGLVWDHFCSKGRNLRQV